MADENEWQFLGSTELTVAGDAIDVTGLTVKKLLQVLSFCNESANIFGAFRMNSLSGSIYAKRRSVQGLTDATIVSQTEVLLDTNWTTADTPFFTVMDIVNINGEEKLGISHNVSRATAGAGNAPDRTETVFKCVPSPLTTDIDEINILNQSSGSFGVGSSVDVAGAD